MLVRDIVSILEAQSPPEYAEDWDNVGLLCGRSDKEVKRVAVALDATTDVIERAIECKADMLVTHHPIIFGKINRVNDQTVLGRKLLTLVESGISCYAMHTNFDTKGGMAKLAGEILSLKNAEVLEETKDGEGIGVIGLLERSMTLKEVAELTKERFCLSEVLCFGDSGIQIDKVAVCPGSGKSVIDISIKKGAGCLITGDIGHHDGIDAMDAGLTIIDASHQGLEKIFTGYIRDQVLGFYPDFEVFSIDSERPYSVV